MHEGVTVRPLLDWLVVQLDPLPEKQGSIFLPTKGRVYTGKVIAAGPGRRVKKTDVLVPNPVKAGDTICFFRENFEHRPGKKVQEVVDQYFDDSPHGMIRATDVLGIIEGLKPGEKVQVYG